MGGLATQPPKVRLTPEEISAIKRAVAEVFGQDAQVRVFGSRADLSKRGGDLDLLIEASPETIDFAGESRLASLLDAVLEGRKVDIALLGFGAAPAPIHVIALRDGVRL